MGRNLFDFADEKIEEEGLHTTIENSESLKEKINNLSNKNSDELLSELMKNVQKQKQDGSFDYNNLENMVNTISPYLTNEQKSKIYELLQRIR